MKRLSLKVFSLVMALLLFSKGVSLAEDGDKKFFRLTQKVETQERLKQVLFLNSSPQKILYVYDSRLGVASQESPQKEEVNPIFIKEVTYVSAPPQTEDLFYAFGELLFSVDKSYGITGKFFLETQKFATGWRLDPDSQDFVVQGESGSKITLIDSGWIITRFPLPPLSFQAIAFHPRKWMAFAHGGEIYRIDFLRGVTPAEFSTPVRYSVPYTVDAMTFTQGGKLVLSAKDKKIRVLDLNSGEFRVVATTEERVFEILPHPVVTPRHDIVFYSPRKGVVVAQNINQPDQLIGRIALEMNAPILSMDLSRDGKTLLAATSQSAFFLATQEASNWDKLDPPDDMSFSNLFQALLSDPFFSLFVKESDFDLDQVSDLFEDPSFEIRKEVFEAIRTKAGNEKKGESEEERSWLTFLSQLGSSQHPLEASQRLEEELKLMQKLVRGYQKLHPENAGFSQFAQKVEKIFQKAEGHLKRRDQLIAAINQADAVLEKEFDSSESSDHQWIEAIDFLYEQILSEPLR